MTSERVLKRTYGRRLAPCTVLSYSVRVDTHRESLGKRVRRERDRAGYRSQKAFAEAAGLHERSVASVERGQKVGVTVLGHIEDIFGWPEFSATRYLETGDTSVFDHQPEDPEPSRQDMLKLADSLADQIQELQRQLRRSEGA